MPRDSSLHSCACACLFPCPPTEEPNVPVRLVGGPNPKQGRVEVFIRGIWGHVGALSTNGATAVCREIFGAGMRGAVSSQPFFVPDVVKRGVVWRDGDNCPPQADSILSCTGEPGGQWLGWGYWWVQVWATGNSLHQVACYNAGGKAASAGWC